MKTYRPRIAEAEVDADSRKVPVRKLKVQSLRGEDYQGGYMATDAVEDADNRRIREALLGELTPTQRELLRLRNEEGLTLDEIARITGKPKTSATSPECCRSCPCPKCRWRKSCRMPAAGPSLRWR